MSKKKSKRKIVAWLNFIIFIFMMEAACFFQVEPTSPKYATTWLSNGFWLELMDDGRLGIGKYDVWVYAKNYAAKVGSIIEGEKLFFKCSIKGIIRIAEPTENDKDRKRYLPKEDKTKPSPRGT